MQRFEADVDRKGKLQHRLDKWSKYGFFVCAESYQDGAEMCWICEYFVRRGNYFGEIFVRAV